MKTILTFLTLTSIIFFAHQTTIAQICGSGDVWACWYQEGFDGIQCYCIPQDSYLNVQCPEGQVMACRSTTKIEQECTCMDTSKVKQWLKKGGDYWATKPEPCPHCHHWGPWTFVSNQPTGGVTNSNHQFSTQSANVSGESAAEGETSFQLFPNPTFDLTTLIISLNQKENVSVKLFDMTGRLISIIANASFQKGENEITWEVGDISAGTYVVTVTSGDFLQTQIITIAK